MREARRLGALVCVCTQLVVWLKMSPRKGIAKSAFEQGVRPHIVNSPFSSTVAVTIYTQTPLHTVANICSSGPGTYILYIQLHSTYANMSQFLPKLTLFTQAYPSRDQSGQFVTIACPLESQYTSKCCVFRRDSCLDFTVAPRPCKEHTSPAECIRHEVPCSSRSASVGAYSTTHVTTAFKA